MIGKAETEAAINRLKDEIDQFVLQKKGAELEISELNSEVRGKHLPRHRYDSICRRQVELRSCIMEWERQIASRKSRVRQLSTEKTEPRLPETIDDPDSRVVAELRSLRDRYQKLAQDRTRLGHVREMSETFAAEINSVILAHVRRSANA